MIRKWATSKNTGPRVSFVKKAEIPQEGIRGRRGFLDTMPFWKQIVEGLQKGLTPAEAIEVELNPVTTVEGKRITPEKLLAATRHQFRKAGFSKRYSMLVRGDKSRLFIVDHATAAIA
jgi:hypothetical protein